MKAKYFFIYIGIGIAFAAVSLWVFLSRGSNAKAIRAKYKLGGALLTTWALLSAATCGPRIGHPEVLCYDMPAKTDEMMLQEENGILRLEIQAATYDKYGWQITPPDGETVLQSGMILAPEEKTYELTTEIKLQLGGYKGDALVILTGYYTSRTDGSEQSTELARDTITIQ